MFALQKKTLSFDQHNQQFANDYKQRLLFPKSGIEIGRNFPLVWAQVSPNFWLNFSPFILGFFPL